ncbi:hypothetical protein MCC93_05150 [Morococcus cerebrosus]|uniref:Uncharacterized protein n=1 Tax=Morococcus cerebrosus TaxID=1056807 RepID=A0A0C1EHZ5_9NEIS|nr:hypothetical protein MCC93_05150 [Morococcus cerebrosus]
MMSCRFYLKTGRLYSQYKVQRSSENRFRRPLYRQLRIG